MAEFVVVGAGMAGSATARELARAGREVVVLEQFAIGHARGSSHGRSRIFRFSYDDPVYVRMAMDALPLWRELEDECSEQLLITLGGFDAGKSVDAHAAALRACGARYEVLEGRAARARFPAVFIADGEEALYQPDAGIVRPDAAVRAFVAGGVARGAELREEVAVSSLRVRAGGVELDTSEGVLDARVAIVTAGGWARPLLATAGVDLPVVPTRETVAYFPLPDELSAQTLVDWGAPDFYALPSPGQGLKAGLHHAGPVTDASEPGSPSEETVARLSEHVARRYPGADPTPSLAETCIYTNTDDERFIIERHGPIVLGSACSGHGFKFAPLTGRRLAQLALQSD